MGLQNDYEFKLLGPLEVNSIKSENVYLAPLELSGESKPARNRSVWASRKVNLVIIYRNKLDPDKQSMIQEWKKAIRHLRGTKYRCSCQELK